MNMALLVFALVAAALAAFLAVLSWVNGLIFNGRLRGLENRLAMESRVMNLERRLGAMDESLQRLEALTKDTRAAPAAREPESTRRLGR